MFLSPSTDFHYTSVSDFKAVPSEGPKITAILYWLLAFSLVYRYFSEFSESFNVIYSIWHLGLKSINLIAGWRRLSVMLLQYYTQSLPMNLISCKMWHQGFLAYNFSSRFIFCWPFTTFLKRVAGIKIKMCIRICFINKESSKKGVMIQTCDLNNAEMVDTSFLYLLAKITMQT